MLMDAVKQAFSPRGTSEDQVLEGWAEGANNITLPLRHHTAMTLDVCDH